jgi:hypothetical protein
MSLHCPLSNHRTLKDPRQREKVDQGMEEQREHLDNVSRLGIHLTKHHKQKLISANNRYYYNLIWAPHLKC